jgi:hypothetical protein
MAIAVVFNFDGGTAEQYDALVREMRIAGQPASAIAGLFFLAAGPAEGGFRVFDVWESQEALDRFSRDRLMPAAEKIGGIPQPRVEVVPDHAMMR